jgi:aromatic-L-amino-acid decarboxylase
VEQNSDHRDPLALDPETMRRLGYRTVDALVERLGDPEIPPIRRASPQEMARRLDAGVPDGPDSFDALLARPDEDVLPFMNWTSHPGFFAFIPSCGTWPAALGDLIASACNIYAAAWMESAGPSQVELQVLRWFADWVGYPESSAGALVSGGSAANMTALACAREALAGSMSDRLVAYVSDQTHSSFARAARLLGFRPDQVRVLPSDTSFRLAPARVAAAMDADVRAGRTPLIVAATAGSTNTGAIDPLPELAELCHDRGVWLHVDAAYGGFAVLTERGRGALPGLELADSLTLDPHKWLYQPFECGCLLVREGDLLRRAFAITPDYLRDTEVHDDGEVNFADLGLQLTRGTRALKVWLSLRFFGLEAFRTAIDRALDLAELARARIEASEAFELAAPPSLGIVCFRRRFDDTDDEQELERRNARLFEALEESGLALASSTRLRGRYAIRLCILNHTSGPEHVERALDFLEQARVDPAAAGPAPPRYERHRDMRESWPPLRAASVSAARHPLFHGLAPEQEERVLGLALEREAAAGETIVEQWDVSRDFYVVLEGTVEVRNRRRARVRARRRRVLRRARSARLGAGFGYPRLATVVASSPLRLLVFPDGAVNELVAELPSVAAAIRAAVAKRMERT